MSEEKKQREKDDHDIDRYKTANSSLETELARAKEAIDEERARNEKLQKSCQDLIGKETELKNKVDELNKEIEENAKKAEGDEEDADKLAKFKKALAVLKQRYETVKSERDKLKEQLGKGGEGSELTNEQLIQSRRPSSPVRSDKLGKLPIPKGNRRDSLDTSAMRELFSPRRRPRRSSGGSDTVDEETQMQAIDVLASQIELALFDEVTTEDIASPIERINVLTDKLQKALDQQMAECEGAYAEKAKLEQEIAELEDLYAKSHNDPEMMKTLEVQLAEKRHALQKVELGLNNAEMRKATLENLKAAVEAASKLPESGSDEREAVLKEVLTNLNAASAEIEEDLMDKEFLTYQDGVSMAQQISKTLDIIYRKIKDMFGIDMKDKVIVTDMSSFAKVNATFAKLLIRMKRFKNAQADREQHAKKLADAYKNENQELREHLIEAHEKIEQLTETKKAHKEQIAKLMKQIKVLTKSIKSTMKRDKQWVAELKAICPPLASTCGDSVHLSDLLGVFVSQFPIYILSKATDKFQEVFGNVMGAVQKLDAKISEVLQHQVGSVDKILDYQLRLAVTPEQLKGMGKAYGKVLDMLFPPQWRPHRRTSVHEVENKVENVMRLLEMSIRFIPGATVPKRRTIGDFARRIRDCLASPSFSSLQNSQDLDFSADFLSQGGNLPAGRIQEYEEQIARLEEAMSHSVALERMASCLADILDLEIVPGNDADESMVNELLVAIRERIEGADQRYSYLYDKCRDCNKIVNNLVAKGAVKLPKELLAAVARLVEKEK